MFNAGNTERLGLQQLLLVKLRFELLPVLMQLVVVCFDPLTFFTPTGTFLLDR